MTDRDSWTDHQLVGAYAHGHDHRAMDIFFDRHQASLLGFATSILGDPDRAQDVVQEVFMQVMRRPKQILAVDSVPSWLLRVVRNRAIDEFRRSVRNRKALQKIATRPGRPSDADRADGGAEGADDRELVRREIASLAPMHREVVVLKIDHEKSYREIARITGISVSNVGYRLHEAMKILARRLRSPAKRKDRVS
jgi:RNA polymerase sigma-70 factor (ECF subfamily)